MIGKFTPYLKYPYVRKESDGFRYMNEKTEIKDIQFINAEGSIVRRERWYRREGEEWMVRWQEMHMKESVLIPYQLNKIHDVLA